MPALDMQFDLVRTVLQNDTCEVTVCRDAAMAGAGHQQLYTLVAVRDKALGKRLAGKIAVEKLFDDCDDYVGAFMKKTDYVLAFRYYPERQIATSRQIYAADFAQRKKMAVAFLTALAQTGLTGAVGALLLADRNVNIEGDSVYLNYFLDFAEQPAKDAQQRFYDDAALYAFGILGWEYSEKYGENEDAWPGELLLMKKKARGGGFRSFGQIITFIQALPDKLRPRRTGAGKLLDTLGRARRYVRANTARTLVLALVLVTLVYLVYQLGTRLHGYVSSRQNSVYVGMENIGEEYLGERY